MNSSLNLPLVSVIIPCYNCELYVKRAVLSIIAQTYRNIEILITDDCSTDSTYVILQDLALFDSRIKLTRNTTNKRIVHTLNSLIDRANGEFIARMDGDDVSMPQRIEKQVAFLLANHDYGICGTNAWHINSKGRVCGFSMLPHTNREIQIFKYAYSPFYHPSVLIRSELLKANRYEKEYESAEDYELWHRILVDNMGYNLTERLLKYRILKNSISRKRETKEKQQKITNIIQNRQRLLNIYKDDGLVFSSLFIKNSIIYNYKLSSSYFRLAISAMFYHGNRLFQSLIRFIAR